MPKTPSETYLHELVAKELGLQALVLSTEMINCFLQLHDFRFETPVFCLEEAGFAPKERFPSHPVCDLTWVLDALAG